MSAATPRASRWLCLDAIAFEDGPQRKPLEESVAALTRFMDEHPQWIIWYRSCFTDSVPSPGMKPEE
jgi:hypothetical protein